MRFDSGDEDRGNVEDRRGGGIGGAHIGIGGIILLGILSLVFRTNLFTLLGNPDQPAAQTGAPSAADEQRKQAESNEERTAVGAFNDVQRFWAHRLGPDRYQDAKLVLFWDETQSACGGAQSAMGPFYCPGDGRVYIDLGFYRELAQRFGAPGQFAQAYVIAHEVGHHVQDLEGITRGAPRNNQTSVKIELQADCLAGVWGHDAAARGLLDPGEAQQGLQAAAAVGDDRLQRMAGRRVAPESFTHGSSAERAKWFGRGMRSGNAADCDTFAQ
jgi:predicted metalloprotease